MRSIHAMIFTRYPVPGQVKTRLIDTIGAECAARIQRRLTEHILHTTRAVQRISTELSVKIVIFGTGGSQRDYRAWLGDDIQYQTQSGGDLGTRLERAFDHAFQQDATSAIAIGADVPGISASILCEALNCLNSSDVVLGPALDGGYYLIGMNRTFPELFSGIDWGTGNVRSQTLESGRRLGLRMAELEMLQDVDRPDDLEILRNDTGFQDIFTGKPKLSVIIPTLNEAKIIGRVLERVQTGNAIEIIVADGGSQDGTQEIAASAGAHVIEVTGGRAAQQNTAVDVSNGRFLFFLHADTIPPIGFDEYIRSTLSDPAVVAGAFRFGTDDSGVALRLIEWAVNQRSIKLQFPYGDQGLFMERCVFDESGRFPFLPIMEDFELVRILRRRGIVKTLDASSITSARRWRRNGVIRTTVINQILIAGFLCGIPADWLRKLYAAHGACDSHL